MKLIFCTLLACALALPAAARAQEASGLFGGSVAADVAIVSDYVFRGYSQTGGNAAVQGGLTYNASSGLYAGTWASAVNFNDGNDATAELDLFAGYRGDVDGLSYDVGFFYFAYPGASRAAGYNYWELAAKAGYDFGPAAVSLGLAWSPDNFGPAGNDSETYASVLVSVPVLETLSVSAGVGRQMLEGAFNDYTDWNLGTTLKIVRWFDLDVRYFDTNIAGAACADLCDARVVVKISRTF